MADYSELKRKAQEIRDEVKAGANTANRVGLALEDTVKALEAENKRAEQAEEDLGNAVQLLQDDTEDLPSIREKLDTLVVNDLTTGGADKALSAEMGKELSEELTELGKEVSNNTSATIALNGVLGNLCIKSIEVPSNKTIITSAGVWGANLESTHQKVELNSGDSLFLLAGENEAQAFACSVYAPKAGDDANILESYTIPKNQSIVITPPEGATCLVINCLVYSGTTLSVDRTPKIIGINVVRENEKNIDKNKEEIEALNKKFIYPIELQEYPLIRYSILSSLKYATNTLSNRKEIPVKGGNYVYIKANEINESSIVWLQKSDGTDVYAGSVASVSVEPSYILKGKELEEAGAFVSIEADTYITLVAPKDATIMVVNTTGASGQVATDRTPQNIGFSINNIGDLANTEKIKTDIISLNGKEFLDAMFTASKRATRIDSVLKEPPVSLLWFSDIHGDSDNLSRIVNIHDNYAEYIDDMIHCGDGVASYYQNGMGFWDEVSGSEKILNVIGNHECRDSLESGWAEYDENDNLRHSEQDIYDTYFANRIEQWGVNYTEGKCYYYKDYQGHNGTLRLIVLDSMRMLNTANPDVDAQIIWLKQVLEESITNGYHVVIAKHFFNGGELPIASTFTPLTAEGPRSRYYSQGKERSYNLCPIVQPFIDRGLNFVCYINGHVHYDVITKHPDYPKQMSLAVATGNAKSQTSSFYPRVIGTRSQDSFNIITFETITKRIKIFKIGCDHDIYLRKIESCVINYDKCEVEYSN